MKSIKYYVKGLKTVRVEPWGIRFVFIVTWIGRGRTSDRSLMKHEAP